MQTQREYLTLMVDFIEPLTDSKSSREALISSGVLDFWAKFALKVTDLSKERDADDRVAGIIMLADIWYHHPTVIEKDEERTKQVLMSLKRGVREMYRPV